MTVGSSIISDGRTQREKRDCCFEESLSWPSLSLRTHTNKEFLWRMTHC